VSGAAPLALIVAMTESGLMGRGQALPWSWPEDLKHFKRTTKDHVVIMGRRTWDSLNSQFGGPLPKRTNLVVSRGRGGRVVAVTTRSNPFPARSRSTTVVLPAPDGPEMTTRRGGPTMRRLRIAPTPPGPPYSRFWTCSLIRSTSDFKAITARAISTSWLFDPIVFVSRSISCERKSSVRPTSPSVPR